MGERQRKRQTGVHRQTHRQTDTQMQKDRERGILGVIIFSQRLILLVSLIQWTRTGQTVEDSEG